MKTLAKIAAIAAVAMMLAPAVHADANDDRIAQMRARFKASDKNKDGKLTQQEATDGGMTLIAANFTRIDTDKDGFVTMGQLESQLAARSR